MTATADDPTATATGAGAIDAPRAPWALWLRARRSGDRSLGLQRFVGAVQLLGGVTLAASYALGAPAVPVGAAPSILIALGVAQIAVGLWWLIRAHDLRQWSIARPGSLVFVTLAASFVVMGLGGSNPEALWVTSAQCWLIATGFVLPGRRWLVAGVLGFALVGCTWVALEGDTGGFSGDGQYLTALIGLVGWVFAGLWMGRTTGATSVTLARWHAVERQERGLVERLREQLRAVDARAAEIANMLGGAAVPAEIAALRARLQRGVGVDAAEATVRLGVILDAAVAEFAQSAPEIRVVIDLAPGVHALELSSATADALTAVVRRQWGNVLRHASDATTVTLRGTEHRGVLRLQMEDDGHGELPFRGGGGTAWSARQLGRVGGSARYYAGDAGVGFEVTAPTEGRASLSEVPELSVRLSLDRFAVDLLAALRWAGYVGDTLTAHALRDDLGTSWLLMPAFAVVIELILQPGSPIGRRLTHAARLVLASVGAVALTACFSWPAGSPATLVPATTSVVVLCGLILDQQWRWWIGLIALRGVAVWPLLREHGSASLALTVIYPLCLSLLFIALGRFLDRARELEDRAADAVGRSALASATLRGLSLRHDVVDVVLRSDVDRGRVADAVADLEGALGALSETASRPLDPREAVLTGLVASAPCQVTVADGVLGAALTPAVAGAIDRITLIELAGLAVDERASCAPQGVLGRRRLRELAVDWTVSAADQSTTLTLRATPSLAPPDPRALQRLRTLAETVGVSVDSTADRLRLTYLRA